jgi:uncharacterized protein (TIGR02284 family)
MAAEDKDLNRDPLSDEPGSHPVATGVGAAGGAIAGAAAGMVGGPVGMAVGGVVGAVVGGLAGKAAGEAINPSAEEAHWRGNYMNEPYYEQGRSFDDYGPAYRHGLESRGRYADWDEAEPRLRSEWDTYRGGSSLSWDQARPASRAAWDRVDPHYRGAQKGRGSMSNYGTGMSSSDSSLPTGGPNDTYEGAGAYGQGADPGARADMTRDEARGAAAMGAASLGSGREMGASGQGSHMGGNYMGGSNMGSMDSTSTMSSGTLDATTGMDERYSAGAGSTTHLGSPGAEADRGVTRAAGRSDTSGTGVSGAGASVGSLQSAGNDSGDREDIRDALEDLLEVCKDGEYGFQSCAEQAERADLKSFLSRRVEDCRRGAEEIRRHLAAYGGDTDEGGSAMGALHRGWVSIKATLSTYDDKAVMEEAERGEDNALARYRKVLQKSLPQDIRQMVQKQCDGVQRNHDEVKRLRDQLRQRS